MEDCRPFNLGKVADEEVLGLLQCFGQGLELECLWLLKLAHEPTSVVRLVLSCVCLDLERVGLEGIQAVNLPLCAMLIKSSMSLINIYNNYVINLQALLRTLALMHSRWSQDEA